MTDTTWSLEARRTQFDRLVLPLRDQLRRALVAQFGIEIGSDVAAEALAWAWEHIDRVSAMSNPAGFLFRVGQSAARRHRRWQRGRARFPAEAKWVAVNAPDLDREVINALKKLKPNQRVAVLLIKGYEFSYRDVSDLLGVSEAAVTNHLHRGLAQLRRALEEST